MDGNQTNIPPTSGQPAGSPPMLPPPEAKSTMLWIGIAVLIVILAVVYYFLTGTPGYRGNSMLKSPDAMMPASEDAVIEKDLQSMDMNGLDSEMEDIEKELNSQ